MDTIKERLFRVCFLPMSQDAAEKSINGDSDAGTDGDESDIGSFIDSDDGDMAGDEEAYEKLRTTVRTIVRSLYPGIKSVPAVRKAAKETAIAATVSLETRIDYLFNAQQRLAMAMALHPRLGANSKLGGLIGHHDVFMMVAYASDKVTTDPIPDGVSTDLISGNAI